MAPTTIRDVDPIDGSQEVPSVLFYHPGDIVPWHFVPGIIVASFFASLTGTLLTVELLHRKRVGNSFVSRLHMFTCAVSMSLIGIWCMHFIGNRSIVLASGEDSLQLIYSPGYTILSCALPVVGLTFAFYIAELQFKSFAVRRLLDIVTGLLAGLSIVGMHYVGNLGTLNYTLIYPSRYIVAACIIAVGDSIIALALFFYFKERWISVFWKRLFCAVILAVAICGMHFTASVGCTYRLEQTGTTTPSERNIAVIIAGTLCFVAAISVLIVLCYTNHRNKVLAGRAQQVMLACAYFDEDGNIMVTNEGTLPSQQIAKRFTLQNFDDDFGIHHPVFHWIWKASHDWDSVADLIPKMRRHLRQHDSFAAKQLPSSATSSLYCDESYKDSTVLFREGYCIAAADLAERLCSSVDQLGALYDQVIGTGILPTVGKGRISVDAENISSSNTIERGQLMLFTRKLRSEETYRFSAAGFRFAPLNRVGGMIAKTMQVPTSHITVQMEQIHEYAQRTSVPLPQKRGVYLVCLAALARIRSSFLVLVQRDRQEDLPDVQLSPKELTPYQMSYLESYDGWLAEHFIQNIGWKFKNRHLLANEERMFVLSLRDALAALAARLGDEWFLDLVFSSQPIRMRYGASKVHATAQTTLFGFTRLVDIHQGALKHPEQLVLANWDFVRLRQVYYPGCNDHGKMRHEVHAEFGPLLEKHNDSMSAGERRQSVIKTALARHGFTGRNQSIASHDSSFTKRTDGDSELGLVRTSQTGRSDAAPAPNSPKQLWGGILATTDTVIVETSQESGAMEMENMGTQGTATAVTKGRDVKSFIDVLYAQAKSYSSHSQAPRSSSDGFRGRD
ncbi:hypothetical protein MBLNU459_g5616t1 [Dothideomycetes sp. NU459]